MYIAGFPMGPFTGSILWDNFTNLNYQRYGQLSDGGSLTYPASDGTVRVYYPVTDTVSPPKLTLFPPMNGIYKMIFVLVQVCVDRRRDRRWKWM
jgi:hypothetical protein